MATTPRPLADYFAELRDPRVTLKCVHNFMDIILIVVVATIGGADDFVSVAQRLRINTAMLGRTFIKIP